MPGADFKSDPTLLDEFMPWLEKCRTTAVVIKIESDDANPGVNH
ncbi:hypothetical protein P6N53_06425 [Desulforamulus aquiferis]|uniref:Uncharacterized protein n=1 Tax=Desulforamulus aquiferis TaxID=1397668 RepID=A0AAW7ZBS8_9FIRM|nr:hypothetical protein [Desulforamulus aquiferis]MDO7786856.1 hypothetical protein [Desulforamulus aquiferis]